MEKARVRCGLGSFALLYGVPPGYLRGTYTTPYTPPLSLYVGSLTPISSHFGVIWCKGGWAKMAALLIPYWDFDNFQNSC